MMPQKGEGKWKVASYENKENFWRVCTVILTIAVKVNLTENTKIFASLQNSAFIQTCIDGNIWKPIKFL